MILPKLGYVVNLILRGILGIQAVSQTCDKGSAPSSLFSFITALVTLTFSYVFTHVLPSTLQTLKYVLVQCVHHHCTPEPGTIFGTKEAILCLSEREKKWILKSLHNIKGSFITRIIMLILFITPQGG